MLQGRQTDARFVPFDLGNHQYFTKIVDRNQVDLVLVTTLPVAADPVILAAGSKQIVKEALQDLAGPGGVIAFDDLADITEVAGLDR